MSTRYRRVGIFGMGLLGGSVAMGLKARELAEEVWAFDLDPLALERAVELGVADQSFERLGPWIAQLDLGVLAAPVGALKALGEGIASFAAPDTLWTDVGSVKTDVVSDLTAVLPGYVGGHPMAGSERPGVEHADAGLLENAIWVITPSEEAEPLRVQALEDLVTRLGALPLRMDPATHDRLVAKISHLPYLLAAALTLSVGDDRQRDLLMFLAAGGFRDLTRVASGSPEMSRDMVCQNREALRRALVEFRSSLTALEGLLDDDDALLVEAQRAKQTRDALPIVRRALLPRRYDAVVPLPDRPGELARITGCLAREAVNIKDIEVLTVREAGGGIRLGFVTAEDRACAEQALAAAGYALRVIG